MSLWTEIGEMDGAVSAPLILRVAELFGQKSISILYR
jgi:hypothetical protein